MQLDLGLPPKTSKMSLDDAEMFPARRERAALFSKSARRQFIHDSVMEMYCAGCGCGL